MADKSLLVVDDSATMRQLLCMTLTRVEGITQANAAFFVGFDHRSQPHPSLFVLVIKVNHLLKETFGFGFFAIAGGFNTLSHQILWILFFTHCSISCGASSNDG